MPLSPDDSRPPYLQIAADLRDAIQRGELAPGARLPSTSELALQYGVARGTVRAALRPLHEEGLLVARQGSGVFVRSSASAGMADQTDQQDTLADSLETVMENLAGVIEQVRRLDDRVAELEAAAQSQGTAQQPPPQ
jgi:DNA-binding GntR family transcriptional regulator